MAGRGLAAVAAALAVASAARAAGPVRDPPCELGRVDRGRMPSRRCIACHDQTADAIAPARGPRTHENHPVEVEYAAVAREHPADFVQPARLPPHVPLVDGKLACTSCHDGASRHRGRVVDPANLCTSCHER